jgi:hypothetical protein
MPVVEVRRHGLWLLAKNVSLFRCLLVFFLAVGEDACDKLCSHVYSLFIR